MNTTNAFHVGLNAHLLSLGGNYRSAGPNWYVYHLLSHLPAVAPELQFTVFLYEPRYSSTNSMRVCRPRWSTGTPHRRILWEQLAAPAVLLREQIDLLHAMAFVAPILSPCPTVITVYDLSFLLFPSAFKPLNRSYLQLMTRISVRRARQVIAISESTRQDVIAWLGVPAERVRTIYCGVDPSFLPASRSEIEDFRQRKGLPERYVLFLGTLEPRKNVARLVEAFADLCARDPREMADVHLVLAGAKGWLYDSLYDRVRDRGLTDRVHWAGYVPEEEKRLWYSAATCFCFPSLYEGFGLPPLEAMACGVPVITSNLSSLPEVVGDAGITVPPEDTTALSEALHRVLTDPVLHAELAGKGRTRARRFTWAEAARQTAATYHLARGQG